MSKQLIRIAAAAAAIALAGCQSTPVQGKDEEDAVKDLKEMVLVSGGSFQMGGRTAETGPRHTVTVNDFLIGKYEVTVGAFKAFVEATGYKTTAEERGGEVPGIGGFDSWKVTQGANWKNPHFYQSDLFPVVLVSWNDAVAYCNWLSEQEGLTPAYTVTKKTITPVAGANGYRLPTEAEWEYAARGGDGSPGDYRYAGGNSAATVAWYRMNSNGRTNEVGKKTANGLGLYDMSGNVYELCGDYWATHYEAGDAVNPQGPSSGTERVCRGGAWNIEDTLLVTTRSHVTPTTARSNIGFRVVRSS